MPLRDIIGQPIAVQSLKNFLKKDTIPHAFLFHGEEGCGKHTTAVAFAQAINCTNTADDDACGACSTCRRIQRNTDVDVLTYEPQKKEYLVEEVNPIRKEAFYTPNTGRRKVLILEKAEALSRETGNMLLKVLEEPPPSTIFVLISDTPYHILPTIRSRSIPILFRPLQPAEMRSILDRSA
ncbi:MAG: DNA polymerase III subunit delta', partial [bacterium]